MRQAWIMAAALAALAPGAACADQAANRTDTPRLTLPRGASLVATAEVDQLRAFPEQQPDKSKPPHEAVVGVRAVDRVYETDRSYADAVKFFDQQATQHGNTQVARATTKTSTAWIISLPKGKVVNAIVRNTQPTTIETVSANDVVTEIEPGAAGR